VGPIGPTVKRLSQERETGGGLIVSEGGNHNVKNSGSGNGTKKFQGQAHVLGGALGGGGETEPFKIARSLLGLQRDVLCCLFLRGTSDRENLFVRRGGSLGYNGGATTIDSLLSEHPQKNFLQRGFPSPPTGRSESGRETFLPISYLNRVLAFCLESFL